MQTLGCDWYSRIRRGGLGVVDWRVVNMANGRERWRPSTLPMQHTSSALLIKIHVKPYEKCMTPINDVWHVSPGASQGNMKNQASRKGFGKIDFVIVLQIWLAENIGFCLFCFFEKINSTIEKDSDLNHVFSGLQVFLQRSVATTFLIGCLWFQYWLIEIPLSD